MEVLQFHANVRELRNAKKYPSNARQLERSSLFMMVVTDRPTSRSVNRSNR